MPSSLTDGLTAPQATAVEHFGGPLLVLAGPGSGKTRVITRRIARLIERGVAPRQILAITFTNKASKEMAERVEALVPGNKVWISTFHKFCARLLRKMPETVGLKSNYTIYDTSDQQSLLRNILSQHDLDATSYSPAKLLNRIGRLKNECVTAEQFARGFEDRVGDHVEAVLAKVYPAYQQGLLEANAVDFDDLLLHVVKLLSENEDLRADLDERYRYVLVDEYQDTNIAQYTIVRALSVNHPNLCVTGDPDQSIYGWRGARIENILRFERDYPGAKVVRLEDNFRSTPGILRAADELIAHNVHRKAKTLKTSNSEGVEVRRVTYRDGKHEADGIASEIAARVRSGERRYDDYAIFYRVNSLSRELEIALARNRVPLQIASGVAFYDRAEIKDVLAYLRILHNPADSVAFRRVVNKPKRSIGETSQRKLLAWATNSGLLPIEACAKAYEVPGLSKAAANALKKFGLLIDSFTEVLAGSVANIVSRMVQDTKLSEEWRDSSDPDDMNRLANVEELINAAAQFDAEYGEEASLEGFLETVSLTADVDSVDESTGQVTLMTLHAAKGLEFPCVYVVAVEHGLLPHERAASTHDLREIEEERRLLFVGVTRARQELTVTHAAKRENRGRSMPAIPSEFLFEMTLDHVDETGGRGGYSRGFADYESNETPFDDEEAPQPFADEFDDTGNAHEGFSRLRKPSAIGNEESNEPQPQRRPKAKPAAVPGLKLTTAADLLAGDATAASLPTGFGVGMRVRHPQYGTGTVIAADGFARNRRVTVDFDDDRSRKTFVASKCPLQPIGAG